MKYNQYCIVFTHSNDNKIMLFEALLNFLLLINIYL